MPSASKAKREAKRQGQGNASKESRSKANGASGSSKAASVQLLFPPSLTARQRAIIHAVGERHGLPHTSTGDGDTRSITLGSLDAAATVRVQPLDSNSAMSDEELVALIREHLSIDAGPEFAGSEVAREPPKSTKSASSRATDGAGPGTKQVDVDQFVRLMEELVELERDAEVAAAEDGLSRCTPEMAQGKGRVLLNLRLDDAEGGLLGRTLLTLVRNKGAPGEDALPPHKFSPHDIVRVRAAKGEPGSPALAQGIVYRVKESSIIIAVDDVPEDGLDVPLKLEKLANKVTYDRLRKALQGLGYGAATGTGACGPLIDVMFNRRPPRFATGEVPWTPVNDALDASQRGAVAKALAAADLALIHGPPGTGKTTAVVEVIAQEVSRGARVLACAASNIAVDNLVERIASLRLPKGRTIDVVRMGHPARLLPKVLDSSLEAKVLRSDDSSLAKDCRKEIKNINARLLKLGRKDRAERTALRKDLRQLAKEERQRQERAVASVLASAQVVCATLTGLGGRNFEQLPPFDMVVIDEAAQALEPACWAALLRGRKAVLAGDHLQLPPTVTSEEAARRGLLLTLFERCHAAWGELASTMLTTQYRMHADIMQWSSDEMYGGKLRAHDSVAEHSLQGLPGVGELAASTGVDLPILLLVDTAGCEMEERKEDGGDSTLNEREAAVAMAHVRRLLAAGVAPGDIGVITPYAAQVGLLRELRPEGAGALVEISTVDGFQGREKEAIVISMVRSNTSGEVGFLADSRRMNVAVTRARRHCALVCDSDTVKGDPFLKRLVEYFESNGEYECAEEVLQRA